MLNYTTAESQYLDIAAHILTHGEERQDRTGTGTKSLFSPPAINIDLNEGFPLLTTKEVDFKNICTELFWMLNGDTNIAYLKKHGCNIWNEWADADGDLGWVYGKQWRTWEDYQTGVDIDGEPCLNDIATIDQISELIDGLQNNPYSRRHIVSAWNVGELNYMNLPPCHCFFQCYVSSKGLSLKMYQRSADWFLGVPYNIASYALLTHLLAHRVGLPVHRLIITYGDAHIYKNHVKQVKKQLIRDSYELPKLEVLKTTGILTDMQHDFVKLTGYKHHPAIRAKVSV